MPSAPLTSLRRYLDVLSREDQVVEIAAEVDPHLEAAEIHRRVVAAGGPVLLFRRLRGSRANPRRIRIRGPGRRWLKRRATSYSFGRPGLDR